MRLSYLFLPDFPQPKAPMHHYVCALKKGETIRTSGLAGFYKMKDGKISSIRVYCTLNEYNPEIFGGTESN